MSRAFPHMAHGVCMKQYNNIVAELPPNTRPHTFPSRSWPSTSYGSTLPFHQERWTKRLSRKATGSSLCAKAISGHGSSAHSKVATGRQMPEMKNAYRSTLRQTMQRTWNLFCPTCSAATTRLPCWASIMKLLPSSAAAKLLLLAVRLTAGL